MHELDRAISSYRHQLVMSNERLLGSIVSASVLTHPREGGVTMQARGIETDRAKSCGRTTR